MRLFTEQKQHNQDILIELKFEILELLYLVIVCKHARGQPYTAALQANKEEGDWDLHFDDKSCLAFLAGVDTEKHDEQHEQSLHEQQHQNSLIV